MLDLKIGDKVRCISGGVCTFTKNKIYVIDSFTMEGYTRLVNDFNILISIQMLRSDWELVTDNIKKGPFERDPVPENAWDISNIDVPDFEKLAETFNKNQYEFISSLKTKSKT